MLYVAAQGRCELFTCLFALTVFFKGFGFARPPLVTEGHVRK